MSVTITEREQQAKSQEKPGHKNPQKVFIRQSLNCLLQAKIYSSLQFLQLPHDVTNTAIFVDKNPLCNDK